MLKDLDKFFVGYDKMAQKLAEVADQSVKLATNYPPFNIKKVDENRYVIELAVAGFSQQDIEVEMIDGKLIIKGNVASAKTEEKEFSLSEFPIFLYQGLAQRAFTRQFSIADNVEIEKADLLNGILKIWLEAIVPETKKPTKIKVTTGGK